MGFYSPERRIPEPASAGRVQSTRLAWPAEAQEPRGEEGRACGTAQLGQRAEGSECGYHM